MQLGRAAFVLMLAAGLLYPPLRSDVVTAATDHSPVRVSRLQQSVVEIYMGGPDVKDGATGGCSGVYLGNGLVLTARHCVLSDPSDATSKLNDLWVVSFNGQTVKAVTTSFGEDNDYAFLTVEGFKSAAAQLACRAPVLAEPVTVIGHPFLVLDWAVSTGIVSTNRPLDNDVVFASTGKDTLGILGWRYLVAATAPVLPGNSGGPVFDANGDVIGVLVAGFGSFSGFIPMSAICAELPRL